MNIQHKQRGRAQYEYELMFLTHRGRCDPVNEHMQTHIQAPSRERKKKTTCTQAQA